MTGRGEKRAPIYARARLDAHMPPPQPGDPVPHPCIAQAMLAAWGVTEDTASEALLRLSEKYALRVWRALLEAGAVS
jgi:hypothetical protein